MTKGNLKREVVLRISVPPTHTPPNLWTVAVQKSMFAVGQRENQERKWAHKELSPCLTLRAELLWFKKPASLHSAGEVKLYVSGGENYSLLWIFLFPWIPVFKRSKGFLKNVLRKLWFPSSVHLPSYSECRS